MFISKFESFARREGLINYNKSEKFETKQKLICIFLWFITFRFILASITTNPRIWAIIGDPFYYSKDRVLINLVLFCISLLGTLLMTTISEYKIA